MTGSAPPKVAIVVGTQKLSGAQKRAIKIFRGLVEQGYAVELWLDPALKRGAAKEFPREAEAAIEYNSGGGLQRLFRPIQRSAILWDIFERSGIPRRLGNPRFERLAAERGIDVAHVFLDLQIGHVRGVRTIFELSSPDIANEMSSRPLPRQLSHKLYHAVSPNVARIFASQSPFTPMVEAIGPYFAPTTHSANAVKRDEVIFAHRFIPRKNAALFARVARRFVEFRPDWTVRIIGWGDCEDEVRAAITGAGDRIELLTTNNVPSFLAHSKVFVSLIQPDNYPSQSVMEAMAAGNALCLSDTGDSVARFLDGNGVATELEEAVVLDRLLELTSDQERLQALGERSRQLIAERFSAEAYLRHIKQLYARVADAKSKGPIG